MSTIELHTSLNHTFMYIHQAHTYTNDLHSAHMSPTDSPHMLSTVCPPYQDPVHVLFTVLSLLPGPIACAVHCTVPLTMQDPVHVLYTVLSPLPGPSACTVHCTVPLTRTQYMYCALYCTPYQDPVHAPGGQEVAAHAVPLRPPRGL